IDFTEKKIFKTKSVLVTEEELKTLIEVGETEGTLERDERKMLERLFEFSDLNVHSIMRHRSLVKYISTESSLDEVIALFQTSGYSRIPVYENDVENIVGVLHFKSVLFASPLITQSHDFIKICMQPASFVPETMSAIDLLKKFKKERINFAVAVNEYGGMAGIVTLDDILREVFGRITDEHGSVEASPENRITVAGTNEFIVPGDMKLDDLNDVLNINISSDTFDTLGGWLLEQFDELPPVGSVHKKSGVLYIVEDQSQRRIQTVRIKL
ncbi:MAG: HlyC/CorC family transporter, partial [Treponema sp.]|nr:HlyC/CorC family transporter [Candidatus Treponema equi]